MPNLWTRRAALAGAAALVAPRLASAQARNSIVIGGVIAEDTVPVWHAADTGLFQHAGLAVDVRKISSGTAGTLGVVGGAFNVANTNLLSVINAHVRNVPLTVVVPSGLYNGTTEYAAAVVRKDSPLQTGADLNGRVLGTTGVKDLHSLAVMSWMDQHGGDSRTLKSLEVPFSVIPTALEDGRIDVGMLLQPFLSQALAQGRVRIFANAYRAIAPRLITAVWLGNTNWVNANAETVRQFARVMRDAQAYCNRHRNETATLLSQNSGTDVDAILHGGRETFAQGFAQPRDLQPVVDVAAKYGVIDRKFDAAELISPVVRDLS
jgi:NitT/TauT family transport system substrate-binding protein